MVADSTGLPVLRHGSSGAYVVLERLLLGGAEPGKHRLAAFAQGGIADVRTTRFSSHFDAGVAGSGWAWLKEADQFGLRSRRSGTARTTRALTRRISDTA